MLAFSDLPCASGKPLEPKHVGSDELSAGRCSTRYGPRWVTQFDRQAIRSYNFLGETCPYSAISLLSVVRCSHSCSSRHGIFRKRKRSNTATWRSRSFELLRTGWHHPG